MSSRTDLSVIQFPLVTEKTTELQQAGGQYVFAIRRDASKNDVRRAVQELFNVRVASVRIVSLLRRRKRRGRVSSGHRQVWKKAYVTLAGDQRIELLELA